MRLEHLCDVQMDYRLEPPWDAPMARVAPLGTGEVLLYGEGDITCSGDRFDATGRFSNQARRRSDGVRVPDARGVLRTADGELVMFTLRGQTGTGTGDDYRMLATIFFETEAQQYAWLNTALCLFEGQPAPEGSHIYEVVFEP